MNRVFVGDLLRLEERERCGWEILLTCEHSPKLFGSQAQHLANHFLSRRVGHAFRECDGTPESRFPLSHNLFSIRGFCCNPISGHYAVTHSLEYCPKHRNTTARITDTKAMKSIFFTGTFNRTLSRHGRTVLPSAWRQSRQKQTGGSLGFHPYDYSPGATCLIGLPPASLAIIARRFDTLPLCEPTLGSLRRLLMGHLRDCTLDSRGRFRLSDRETSLAGLEREIVLVGCGNYFEIWNPDRFKLQQQAPVSISPIIL